MASLDRTGPGGCYLSVSTDHSIVVAQARVRGGEERVERWMGSIFLLTEDLESHSAAFVSRSPGSV